MRISIKHALIAGIIGLMLVTVAVSMLSTYFSTEKVLLGHARALMDNVADETIARSVDFLAPAQTAAHLTQKLANHGVVSERNAFKLERYFFEQLRQYPDFAGIYFGLPDGGMIYVMRASGDSPAAFRTKLIQIKDGVRHVDIYWRNSDHALVKYEGDVSDTYDPRVRPWYQDAVAANGLIWTDPYIFFTAQKPGITTASPVFGGTDGNEFKGVIGVDIQISALSDFLAHLKIGQHGSAFIMSRNGDVIAHPNLNKISQHTQDAKGGLAFRKIGQLDDPLARAAYSALKISSPAELPRQQKQVLSFESEGVRYQSVFAPFQSDRWPWVMGIYVPEDDYLGVFKQNQRHNLLAVLVIGLIATLLGFALSRSLSRPISELGRQAHGIMQGQHKFESTIETPYNEIQETADAFKAMNEALVEEKTRTKALNNLLRETSLSTIYRLTEAAEFKDSETGAHISRMSMLAVHIAVRMGLPHQFCEDLMYAAPMHDIGKLGIPDAILFKEGPLNEEEWQVMRTHPELGARILKNPETPILELGRQIALTHHEHWDGNGYPAGLKSTQIPVAGRICAVADVFDALVSDRCYKDAFHIDKVFDIIHGLSGAQFDPDVVAALDGCADKARELYATEVVNPMAAQSTPQRAPNV